MTVDGRMTSFVALRQRMVAEQLGRRGILDVRVLDAMCRVPREEFVPDVLRSEAYDDLPQPIGFQQTISQPYTVAFMCQEAQLTGAEKVLEIGTGSGYGAAVLSCLAQQVHTVERIDELYTDARERLGRLGYDNVRVHHGDGTLGLAAEAPFNAIVVTAGAEKLPEAYLGQLADGGRIVIPIGSHGHQQMYRLSRHGEQWQQSRLGSFGFVPLVSGEAHEER
jgi:protein-L-isoaspartate(D-aspartate) O-methyltransferase